MAGYDASSLVAVVVIIAAVIVVVVVVVFFLLALLLWLFFHILGNKDREKRFGRNYRERIKKLSSIYQLFLEQQYLPFTLEKV